MSKSISISLKEKINKPLLVTLFIIYLIIVIWIIIFKCAIPHFAGADKWTLNRSIFESFKRFVLFLMEEFQLI